MNKPQLPFHCLGMERTTRFLCDAQMLNVMADGLPGVVAYYDVDFVCHFVNATVEAWTGARPSAYLNKRLGEAGREFVAGARAHIERAMVGAHVEFETPVDFAGGMINVVRGFAYPDTDANGRVLGCFVLLLDITRERAFEAQLQDARDEAVEAIRSKSRFLAAASHDLRQPLHAMTLFVSALSRRLSEGEAAELVGNVESSLRSLRSMIDTLLDISKIEAGLIKPNLAPASLAELFAALRPGFGATARDRRLEFRVAPTSAKVVADRTLAELALRNLLANAFKFTRSGGVLLGARRRRGEVGIVVADTGVGVAARPNRARVRGISSRQDDRDRPQRGHRPRARHRQASGGADGRQGHVALAAGQGQRVHAVAARSGLGAAPGMARRGAGRNRSRAGAFSSSTTIRFAPPR